MFLAEIAAAGHRAAAHQHVVLELAIKIGICGGKQQNNTTLHTSGKTVVDYARHEGITSGRQNGRLGLCAATNCASTRLVALHLSQLTPHTARKSAACT